MSDIRLYLGDCLEIMPTLTRIDAVVTDPSYGINYINGGGRNPKNGWRDFRSDGDWDKKRPSKAHFDVILNLNVTTVIWGGNYFTDYLAPHSCWLVWDKGQRDFSLADGELAWTNQDKAMRIFSYPRATMLKENGLHPTQKPIALMKWCIELFTEPGDTILDCFMGSGTTGVACVQTGRNFIGIEIDEGYYKIAAKRIAEAQQQMVMPI